MTSRDFCYWLQGFFELQETPVNAMNGSQIDSVRKHLALVFKHEIDPSAGPASVQGVLNNIHGDTTYRC